MSFAINPEDATNRRQVAAPVAVQGGVVGGSKGVALEAPRQGAKLGSDLTTVLKFSGGAVRERLKQAEEQAFLDGMSRAAQGVAAADIAAERPAWAAQFGDDAATRGARAYERITDSAALQTEVTESMDELRRLPPEQFRDTVFKMLKARETGDAARDGLMLQAVIQWLPNTMVVHAKAHKGWEQAEAIARDTQMKSATFRAYEATMKAGKDDPSLRDPAAEQQAALNVLQSFEPLPGVNPKEHSRRVAGIVRDNLTRGEFGVWNLLKQSGKLDDLDADQRRMMENTAKEAASRYLPEVVSDQVRDAWRTLRVHAADMDEAAMKHAVDTLNARVAEDTGITERPYISAAMIDDLLVRREAGLERRADQAAARAERERERERDRQERKAERKADRDADRAERAAEKRREEQQRQAMVNAEFTRLAGAWAQTETPGGLGVALDVATRFIPDSREHRTRLTESLFARAQAGGPEQFAKTITAVGHKDVPDAWRIKLTGAFQTDKPDESTLATLMATDPYSRGGLLDNQSLAAYTVFEENYRARNIAAIQDPKERAKAVAEVFDAARLNMRLNPTAAGQVSAKDAEAVADKIRAQSGWDPSDNVTVGNVSPALLAHVSRGLPAGKDRADLIAGKASTMLHVSDGVLIHKDPTDPKADETLGALSAENGGALGRHLLTHLDSKGIDPETVEFVVQGPAGTLRVYLQGAKSVIVTPADFRKAREYKPAGYTATQPVPVRGIIPN